MAAPQIRSHGQHIATTYPQVVHRRVLSSSSYHGPSTARRHPVAALATDRSSLTTHALAPIHSVTPTSAVMPTIHPIRPSETGPQPPRVKPPGLLGSSVIDST